MALGNNLRKKKVLPEQKAEDKPKKVVKKKASATAKQPAKAKKKVVEKKAKPVAKASSKPAKKTQEPAVVPVKKSLVPEISREEFERRQALQRRYDEEIEAHKGSRLQLIVFKFNNQRYAVEIGKSREVVKTPAISELPHVPDFVPGLVNIRGFVIVTIDLAHKFFSGTENNGNTRAYTLVVEHGANKLGVLLPDVPDTVIVPGTSVESSSGILADFTRDDTYIKGLVRTEQGMIFLLDIEELIEGNKVRVLPAKNSA